MKKLIRYITPAGIALVPLLAAAQGTGLSGAVSTISGLITSLIPVLMVLATVVFLWGVVLYLTASGDEEKIKSARTYMIWGIVALFVMVAVWGLVKLLVDTFGVGGETTPTNVGGL